MAAIGPTTCLPHLLQNVPRLYRSAGSIAEHDFFLRPFIADKYEPPNRRYGNTEQEFHRSEMKSVGI
ncbi:MAG: hypothetical protein WBW38_03925 [Candidatus Sulfotelmatobacter sp.]